MSCLKDITRCDCNDCLSTKRAIIARYRTLEHFKKVPEGTTDVKIKKLFPEIGEKNK